MVDKFYSVEQIASMIDLHPKTIQRYIREGRLKAQKIGKAWRVSGHDLSVFVEGTDGVKEACTSHGLQSIIQAAGKTIRVSAFIDIPVDNHAEAVQVANWITAMMNARSSEREYSSMNSQYIEPEHMIRIMFCGSPAFLTDIMNSFMDVQKSSWPEEQEDDYHG